MQELKQVRKSKTEIILSLSDNNSRDRTIKEILDSSNIRIPVCYIFRNNDDINKWSKYIIENKRYRFYKAIGLTFEDSIPKSLDSEKNIAQLFRLRNKTIKKILKNNSISKDIQISNTPLKSFYLSRLILKDKNSNLEGSLLELLETEFKIQDY